MEDNKNVQRSSDELLDLLSKYSAENRSVAEEEALKQAAKKDNNGGFVVIEKTASKVKPTVAEKVKPTVAEKDDAVFEAPDKKTKPAEVVNPKPENGKTKPEYEGERFSHYSDEIGKGGTVRAIPEGGHLTDEYGNSVNGIMLQTDDSFSEHHFTGTDAAKSEARQAYKRAKKRNDRKKSKGSVTISIMKAIAYTAVVCCLSFFTVFGFFDVWPGIIPIANDVFAFSKGEKEITVNISNNMTTQQVAKLLVETGVIKEEKVFNFYVRYKYDKSVGLDKDNLVGSAMHLGTEFCKGMLFGGDISPEFEREYLTGTHTLNTNMNYDQILVALTTNVYVREEVTVTIPEGFTAEQIMALLMSKGIGTREGYEYAINQYPYKHEFVQLLTESSLPEDRTYRLEGYLYPDTYIFYKDLSEVEVINKMLNSFSNRVWDEYYDTYKEACDNIGLSFDEMIIFASIVQSEGKSFLDFENVSQVFHNRRNSNVADFRKMESCATIQYAMDYYNSKNGIDAPRKTTLSGDDLKYETPYNTYKYEGLPPGAICNPGLDAIEAALYPDMSDEIKKEFGITAAYYFNSDMAGNIYYAQTPYQHSVNKQTAESVNNQIINGSNNG